MTEPGDLGRLIELCKAGRQSAYESLVDMYAGRCYGYFYRLTGCRDVSEDLVGELFVKLVEKIGTFNGGYFDKWLFTVASNLFHDHLRGRYRRQKAMEEKAAQMTLSSAGADVDNPMIDMLQEKLSILDADTAELITLRFYGQLSFKALADMRGEPIGTTLSKLHRGLKKLREMMDSSKVL